MTSHIPAFTHESEVQRSTSTLKRDPTGPVITTWVGELGLDRQAIVLNVMGVRGAESASRALKARLALDSRTTSANRLVLTWNIIHGLSEQEFGRRSRATGWNTTPSTTPACPDSPASTASSPDQTG